MAWGKTKATNGATVQRHHRRRGHWSGERAHRQQCSNMCYSMYTMPPSALRLSASVTMLRFRPWVTWMWRALGEGTAVKRGSDERHVLSRGPLLRQGQSFD